MEPVVQALQEKYGNQVCFVVVDVEKTGSEEAAKLVRDFQVSYIPAFFLIDKQGNVIDEIVGTVTQEDLEAQIKKLLQ